MMNVAALTSDMKRYVFQAKGTALVDSLRELSSVDADTSAWAEHYEDLQETISQLERENAKCRMRISELVAEVASLRPYLPTRFGQHILQQFRRANTTELREAAIVQMCSEDEFDVGAALSELCDHKLLAAAEKGDTDRLYVVTTKGQSLCISCRR